MTLFETTLTSISNINRQNIIIITINELNFIIHNSESKLVFIKMILFPVYIIQQLLLHRHVT